MKTLTVRLPDALADELESEARARGISKSVVVRERLEAVQARGTAVPSALAGLGDLIGYVEDDLPADLSARKKYYLEVAGFGGKRSR